MLTSLFRRAPVEDFAKSLASDVLKRYPAVLDQDPSKRPSINRLTRIVEDLCKRAVEFHAEHRLSWMAKAKLANAFRWELVELGYRKEFVNMATEAIVVQLSAKRAS
jgi:hypothetical protein